MPSLNVFEMFNTSVTLVFNQIPSHNLTEPNETVVDMSRNPQKHKTASSQSAEFLQQ